MSAQSSTRVKAGPEFLDSSQGPFCRFLEENAFLRPHTMRDPLIALGLRSRPSIPEKSGSAVQRLLLLLFDFIAEVDPLETGTLTDRFDMYRLLADSSDDPERLEALIQACAEVCKRVTERLATQRRDQKAETAALLGLVHDTLLELSGSDADFTSKFGDSMKRFDGLSDIDDVRQLKVQLAREVALVRQLAAERQKNWEDAYGILVERVHALEENLTQTRVAASIDAVTRVATRSVFETACQEWLGSARRFVLALIDVDRLKSINDTYGHQVGDRTLATIANALKDSFRADLDVVARYGGDEFVLLARDMSFRQTESRLRMLMQSLRSSPIDLGSGRSITITLSCGMAEYSAGDTLESLVERADAAMYESKRVGGDRIAAREKPTLRSMMQH